MEYNPILRATYQHWSQQGEGALPIRGMHTDIPCLNSERDIRTACDHATAWSRLPQWQYWSWSSNSPTHYWATQQDSFCVQAIFYHQRVTNIGLKVNELIVTCLYFKYRSHMTPNWYTKRSLSPTAEQLAKKLLSDMNFAHFIEKCDPSHT